MDKKYLEDYSAREFGEFENYTKNISTSEEFGQYPANNRFKILREPIMFFDPFSYNNYKEKIWSQIPFAGTLIISLRNVQKEDSLQHQSFEYEDIPQLIELAKETGRIQFGLQDDPLRYENLDYLDDIFTELNPPMFHSTPFELITDKTNFKNWSVSFDQHASISYFQAIESNIGHKGSLYTESIIEQHKGIYLILKILGWDNEIENLENMMVDDPQMASILFEKYAILTSSKFSSFSPNVNWGLRELQKYDLAEKNLDNVFHPEIGTYILKKSALNPSDYHECRSVIDRYEQNQLYSVYSSLHQSMQNQRYGDLTTHADSLKEIMDNAWEDGKKLIGRKRTIKLGLDIIMGAVGLGITSLAGLGYVGLLSGLGFHVAENNIPWSAHTSEKILRKFQPDYLVNIYDFHKLTEKSS